MLKFYDYLDSGNGDNVRPAIAAWLERVRAQPGHIAIDQH